MVAVGPPSKFPSAPTISAVPPAPTRKYQPGTWDIWLLGITIVIGGQYFSWNAGITGGLYSYSLCYALIASAYVMLCCCTSEITGCLPFAGGAYGLARCTLGFYPAFLIGCCEALEYIAYVSTSVLSLTDMIVQIAPSLGTLRPLVWALFYVTALIVHIYGDRVFWRFNAVIGALSLLILLVFCFGSLPYVDYAQHAASNPTMVTFIDGFPGFIAALPLATWFFVGVEALNMASDHVVDPRRSIPLAQLSCIATLVVTGAMVFAVTISLPPGLETLPTELDPFNRGFELIFGISSRQATILSLPATYATAFGFMWCYGKLIAAMATSRLLPSWLARTHRRSGTPHVALLAGSALSYAICGTVYAINGAGEATIASTVFTICITAAFMSYTGQCIGYISLKKTFRNIKSSSFRSPFGIAGAVYSMCVWLLGLVSVVGFQGHRGTETAIFGGVVLLLTVYYYAWARKRQVFSAQENRVMMVAHVVNFNLSRNSMRRGGNRGSNSSMREANPRLGSVPREMSPRLGSIPRDANARVGSIPREANPQWGSSKQLEGRNDASVKVTAVSPATRG